MKTGAALAASIAALWIGLCGLEAGATTQAPGATEAVAALAASAESTETATTVPPPALTVVLSPREIRVGDLFEAVVTIEYGIKEDIILMP